MISSHKPVAFIDLMIFARRDCHDITRIAIANVDIYQIGRTRCNIRLNLVCAFWCAVRRRCNTERCTQMSVECQTKKKRQSMSSTQLTWRCIEHSCFHSFEQRLLRMVEALRRAGNIHSMVSINDIDSNCHHTDTPCSCFRHSCSSNCRRYNCKQWMTSNQISSKAWFRHVFQEVELTQCLQYYVVRRCFDGLRWLEFSVAESDWRWKRAETMREWPWRHWLLVICQNPSFSPNCQLMHRPNRWIHSTSCQSEKICRLAVVSRALLCILSDGHCRKCTICKCLVRAHSDDLARSSAHESHDIRPTDWFVAPKDLQTYAHTTIIKSNAKIQIIRLRRIQANQIVFLIKIVDSFHSQVDYTFNWSTCFSHSSDIISYALCVCDRIRPHFDMRKRFARIFSIAINSAPVLQFEEQDFSYANRFLCTKEVWESWKKSFATGARTHKS